MPNWSKLTSIVLVVLIGATASLILVLNQGDRLVQEVDRYPAGATSIYIYDVTEERSAGVLSVLGEFADAGGRAVVRVDPQANNVDGGLSSLRIGVIAKLGSTPAALDLRHLGTTLFDTATISKLLTSAPAKSIGLDANAADVITGIPELTFAPRISVVQLPHLVDSSGTINGTYRVVGASPAELNELLRSLATATGHSPDSLRDSAHGQDTDGGLLPLLLLGFMIAASLLLLLVLVFEAVRTLPVLGVHVLVGKSQWGFAIALLRPVWVTIGATMALSVLFTVMLAQGYRLNGTLLTAAWSGAVVGALPAVLCVGIAVAVLVSTKPVNAILGRFSKKILLGIVACFSVLAVAGFSSLLVAVDGPINEVGKLANVRQTWASVEHQQVLYKMSAGTDSASFTGGSTQLVQDFYHWYSSIADKPGVTLIHSEYYDRQVVDAWATEYKSAPTKPFWYMTASPSALAAQGFTVSDDLVARAKRGERVFLLPDTWNDATKRAMRGWLDEDTHEGGAPSIRTKFYDSDKLDFEEYAPKTPLFSWTTDPTLPTTVTDPVIVVTTPENMVWFESESLDSAGGLENSLVKLSAAAARQYTSTRYLARYHLDDNQVTFLPVSEYIAGLTKSIQATLQLFGGVILFGAVLVVISLVALLRLFSMTYREQLAVKRMLGYSLARLFVMPVLVVGVTGVLAVTVAGLMQSKSALFGNIILLAVQLALMTSLIRRYSRVQLSAALKE